MANHNGINGKNGFSKKREDTAQRIIEAIKASNGLLTLAAKKAHVGYTTMWRYTKEFPSVRLAVEEAKETMMDYVEGKLYENIKNGDNACIIFFLKTQGKSRGYIEKQEIEHSGDIGKGAEQLTDEQLIAIIERNRRRSVTQKEQGS